MSTVVPAAVPAFTITPPDCHKVSRYRSLRGKSVSAPQGRLFDVFKDDSDLPAPSPPPQNARNSVLAARRRSKSMSAAVALSIAATTRPSPVIEEPDSPAMAQFGVLAPRHQGLFSPVPPPPPAKGPSPAGTSSAVGLHVLSRKASNINMPTAAARTKTNTATTTTAATTPKKGPLAGYGGAYSSDYPFDPAADAENQYHHYHHHHQDPSSPSENTIIARKALNRRAVRSNSTVSYAVVPTASEERAAQLERQAAERRRQEEEEEAARYADEVARLDAQTDFVLAEHQRKLDLARVRAQLASTSTPPPKSRNLILGKFNLFSRGRKSNATNSPSSSSPSPTAPTVFSLDFSSRSTSLEDSPLSDSMNTNFIEQGGKGIVPQTDAPTAASNGGERRVTVRCLSSTINLPVTTETTPVEILWSTANFVTHNINPETSTIVECYVELGLERRLRRYERVRDVMNSWDRDQQNSLLVLPAEFAGKTADLEAKYVPRSETAPQGFTFQLHHSSRPGKWNKRWVTLLETGQMYASKKQDAKPSDKDSTVLCHLSDFDIYTPRESEVRRHLKPPKRFCYAVKSQQKTFVFPNGENFVHFFSTEDQAISDQFYELIHGWRSWYLVHKQIDLYKKNRPPQITSRSGTVKKPLTKSKSVVSRYKAHKIEVSIDDSPYKIGNFSPLLDLGRFDKPIDEFGKETPQPAPIRNHQRTPSKGQQVVQSPLMSPSSESEFSAGGLLGDAYEKRKLAERVGHVSPKTADGPFTQGPSLLNGGVDSPTSPQDKPEPKGWFPSATEHTARSRSRSLHNTGRRPTTSDGPKKGMPQPLVNLTSFPEPPNRWREGHGQGHGVKVPNGAPLINFATSVSGALGLGQLPMRNGNRAGSAIPGSQSTNRAVSSSSSRPRSRSLAGLQASARMEDLPPVPPLPHRSDRRAPQPLDSPRGRDPRPREPLIKRAGTGTLRY